MSKTFFNDYPRFRETSSVASNIDRLNFRYSHVIDRNRGVLEGKRVLDLASHDARFTFAALRGAGAAHVTAIEARRNLVDSARETLTHYEVPEDRYSLVCGDLFEALGDIEKNSIDTAMVLGFLYHTARQYEVISTLSELGVKNIIVDSNTLRNKQPVIRLRWEGTELDSQIWDSGRKKVLSSMPSAGALQMLLEEFGYTVERFEPKIAVPASAKQYTPGKRPTVRVTMVGTRG